MAQSDIKITFEDLKRLLQKISVSKWHNGQTNPTDEEFKELLRVLSNQDEVKDFLTK
jgi:DNA-binding transcriptional regulator GbsR (MarR family)